MPLFKIQLSLGSRRHLLQKFADEEERKRRDGLGIKGEPQERAILFTILSYHIKEIPMRFWVDNI